MSPAPSFTRDCALALSRLYWTNAQIVAFVQGYCRSEIREHGELWAVLEVRAAHYEVRASRRYPKLAPPGQGAPGACTRSHGCLPVNSPVLPKGTGAFCEVA